MRVLSICFFTVILSVCSKAQELKTNLPFIKEINYQNEYQVDFVRYAICQLRYEISDTTYGLKTIKGAKQTKSKLEKFAEIAVKNNVNVLVFPELAMALGKDLREKIITTLQGIASKHDMIIIAGSYYNSNRESTVPIILPNQTVYSYKIKQSKFEVSPIYAQGMERGDTLVVIDSKYGKILPIVCVDLISDDVQYVARYLSNKNKVNTLINICYNPAAPEFMREMSAIVKRHNLFGLIANVTNPDKNAVSDCNEYGFGNTSVFASLFIAQSKTTALISECFKNKDNSNLHPSYSTLISQIKPKEEGMILLDLNLSTVRPPKRTNAPDQGYPTVRNLRILGITE